MTNQEKQKKIKHVLNEITKARNEICVYIVQLECTKKKFGLSKSNEQRLNCMYNRYRDVMWIKPNTFSDMYDTLYKVIDYILSFVDKGYVTTTDKKKIINRLCEIYGKRNYNKIYPNQMKVFVEGLMYNLIYFRGYENYKWKILPESPMVLKRYLSEKLEWYKLSPINFDFFSSK